MAPPGGQLIAESSWFSIFSINLPRLNLFWPSAVSNGQNNCPISQVAPPGGELTSYFNSEWSITLNWPVILALWPPIWNFSRERREKLSSYWPAGFAAGKNKVSKRFCPNVRTTLYCFVNSLFHVRRPDLVYLSPTLNNIFEELKGAWQVYIGEPPDMMSKSQGEVSHGKADVVREVAWIF